MVRRERRSDADFRCFYFAFFAILLFVALDIGIGVEVRRCGRKKEEVLPCFTRQERLLLSIHLGFGIVHYGNISL